MAVLTVNKQRKPFFVVVVYGVLIYSPTTVFDKARKIGFSFPNGIF
jgi:hypothetical protein